MELKEGVHYDWHTTYIKCRRCGKVGPVQYTARNISYHCASTGKKYGRDQLMRLWAWYNFRRHLVACWRESSKPIEKGGD